MTYNYKIVHAYNMISHEGIKIKNKNNVNQLLSIEFRHLQKIQVFTIKFKLKSIKFKYILFIIDLYNIVISKIRQI